MDSSSTSISLPLSSRTFSTPKTPHIQSASTIKTAKFGETFFQNLAAGLMMGGMAVLIGAAIAGGITKHFDLCLYIGGAGGGGMLVIGGGLLLKYPPPRIAAEKTGVLKIGEETHVVTHYIPQSQKPPSSPIDIPRKKISD